MEEFEIKTNQDLTNSKLINLGPQEQNSFIEFGIKEYIKKEGHKLQKDLPERCFNVNLNTDIDECEITAEEELALGSAIQLVQNESKKTNKPLFIIINTGTHYFCLPVFKDKIVIFDSYNLYDNMVLMLESLIEKLGLTLKVKEIEIKQQNDSYSCPYFTVFNITRLDKWFQEDIENFHKLFNEGLVPFSIITSMQTVKGIKQQLDIEEIIPTEDKSDYEIKFNKSKQETKAKKFFDIKKSTPQIIKLKKYLRINKSSKDKLQNLRVFYKSQKMYERFEQAQKTLGQSLESTQQSQLPTQH